MLNINKILRSKVFVFWFLFFYLLSLWLNNLFFFPWEEASAYTPEDTNNDIVAVLVDSDIYSSNEWDIQWYAQEYVQQNITDSKALIIPVNSDNFQATDIQRILENLYFEGQKDAPSSLVWTVLIWDVPYPVVDNNWYVYPSIYPYVNFENKKYVFDSSNNFFNVTSNVSSTPDIWHWVINFDSDSEYWAFFDKLRDYSSNPTDFVDRKFWFEDFTMLQNFFNEDNLSYYLNNFVFLEDIAYHRYTYLMYEILQWNYRDYIKDKVNEFDDSINELEDQADLHWDSEFQAIGQEYFDQARSIADQFPQDELDSAFDSAENVPTLLIKESLESMFKDYNEIFGQTYFSEMRDNLLATWRWTTADLSTHVDKIYLQDQLSKDFLVSMNHHLEEEIYDKVEEQDYYMYMPVFAKYRDDEFMIVEEYTDSFWQWWNTMDRSNSTRDYRINEEYENFYFWKAASHISEANELSIYRWNFRNYSLSDLEWLSYPSNDLERISNDVDYRSIWASHWIFSTQIEANRWYNVENAEWDWDLFESERFNDEDIQYWASRWWWWASPLNLDWDAFPEYDFYNMDNDNAWNPHWDRSIWWSIYDLAWSKAIGSEEEDAYSYKAYETFASPIRVRENERQWGWWWWSGWCPWRGCFSIVNVEIDYRDEMNKDLRPYSDFDFFDVYNNEPSLWEYEEISIWSEVEEQDWWSVCLYYNYEYSQDSSEDEDWNTVWDDPTRTQLDCARRWHEHRYYYDYVMVDTRVNNIWVTEEQLEEMNFSTLDRPIDEKRNLTFKWIAWDLVEIVYPNVFNIQVFEEDWDKIVLKSKEDIRTAVEDYYRDIVDDYNSQLEEQLANSSSFYSQNSDAYDFLELENDLATPNRDYELMDEDYLLDEIWEENIDRIVESLYYLNIWWKEREFQDWVLDNIDQIKEDFDIDKKIQYVINNQTSTDMSTDPVENPNYVEDWYEAWLINSAWSDSMSLWTTELPEDIRDIQRAQSTNDTRFWSDWTWFSPSWDDSDTWSSWWESIDDLLSRAQDQEQCWVPPDWAVDLWDWPDAFVCWLEETLSSPFEIHIGDSCSMWSSFVWPEWWESWTASAWWLWWAWSNWWTANWDDSSDSSWQTEINSDNEKNNENLENYNPSQQDTFNDIKNNVRIDFKPNSTFSLREVAPDETPYSIEITSSQDVWNFDVSVRVIWDNCISFDWVWNVCDTDDYSSIISDQNLYNEVYNNDLFVQERVAWTSLFEFEICQNWVCYYENKIANISEWNIDRIEIDAPTEHVIKWWKLPFQLNAYDQFDNPISRTFESYNLQVDLWWIQRWWSLVNQLSVDSFWDYYIYDSSEIWNIAPDEDILEWINVLPSNEFGDIIDWLPTVNHDITLVETSASFSPNVIEYELPNNIDELYSYDDWEMLVNESELINLTVELDDDRVSSPVSITTQNWTLLPWEILEDWSFDFKSNFVLEEWQIDIQLHPSMIAWEDEVLIDIPWLDTETIPVEITPAELHFLDISVEKSSLTSWESNTWIVYWRDIWWNRIDEWWNILVELTWNAEINWSDEITTWLWDDFTIDTEEPWWEVYLTAKIDWRDFDEYVPDYTKFLTEHPLWWSEWRDINVMYMNLFGTDWWNQWWYFSNHDNFVQELISSSSKMLSTTTKLIDPDNIKKFNFILNPDLTINNVWGHNIELDFDWNSLVANIKESRSLIASIDFWTFSNFEVSSDGFSNFGDDWVYYNPSQLDSRISSNVIQDWVLEVNWDALIDFNEWFIHEDLQINLSNELDSWKSYWNLMYKNINIWQIYLHRNNYDIESAVDINSWSLKEDMFTSWSTNTRWWIGIYDPSSRFSDNKSYDSIQDSDDDRKNIWFRNNFANINSFANWNSVWDATKHFASDFLINFWDPVLKRIDENQTIENTKYDWWIWKKVFSDSEWSILEVENFDFDNSWREDLLVAYSNWTVRLLKNYWWSEPFKDMWDLMVISDWIKWIYAWDANWNWYWDIIVHTNNNQLRVYENNNWKMDVNWTPVCLDVSWWPQNLDEVHQLFVQDMNDDWTLDIVTNDKSWDIKVFYDWYISEDNFECDSAWNSRLDDVLVESYWLEMSSDEVYDESLVHWEWLEIDEEDLDIEPEEVPEFWGDSPYDMDDMFEMWFMDALKYQALNSNFTPVYYPEELESPVYSKSSYTGIDDEDPVEFYKTFEHEWWTLEVWDEVIVNINIEANESIMLTYLEDLKWPWLIPRESDSSIIWFDSWNLPSNSIIKWNDVAPYQFKIDNIPIMAWETIEFSYPVYYQWWELVEIEVEDVDNNSLYDIKAFPTNWCLKWYDFFENQGYDFDKEFIDLEEKLEDWISEQEEEQLQAMEEMEEQMEETRETWDLSELEINQSFEQWNQNNVLEWWQLNIDLFEGSMSDHFSDYESIVDGLCGWYKFSDDSCGLNIPVNRAFLAPGYYQDFVCNPSRDEWTPFFWYPWTRSYTTSSWCVWPIPTPNMWTQDDPSVATSAPTWCMSAQFPSQIRLYASPTLTASAWFAACFWTYESWTSISNPIWNVAWNCVVTAWSLPLSCDDDDDDNWEWTWDWEWTWLPSQWWSWDGSWTTSSDHIMQDWQYDMSRIWQCESDPLDVSEEFWRTSSPASMWTVREWFPWELSWEYLWWLVDFQTSPINVDMWELSDITWLESTEIRWWSWFELNIEWGSVEWLIECIIEWWVDNQIRYIINNLTRMSVYVYLPDLSQVTEWFEQVNIDNFNNILDDLNSQVWSVWQSDWEWWLMDYVPSQEVYRNMSQSASNPFDAISLLFQDVPLINVQTRNITIDVPMVASEELENYMLYLNWWLDRNKAILQEWENIDEWVEITAQAWDLINSVETNIETLQEYKEFPLELYDWLHIVDRYLTELSCIIEEFLNWILSRLEQNASRFESWVDFIILMIWIIETWQILIDFSVNWRQKCAECRVDTYDFYSCQMDVLCIDLPVLPIPPFRLPNIILDFSHVDLWVDVVLPKFDFRPMDVPLLDIPDIPRPPRVSADIHLPELPQLPELPELPEIPSFLPTVEIDLPMLPPAPKVPDILPQIETVVDIAEFIWELLCIIKWWVWMVAEWNVKTRIEQLTQRTSRVWGFDDMQITFPDPPLKGLDIRVDSHIQLQFEFDHIYELANSLADSINESTNVISERVESSTIQFDWVDDFWSYDYDVWAFNFWTWDSIEWVASVEEDNYWNEDNLFAFDESEYDWSIKYEDAFASLRSWLMYFYEMWIDSTRASQARDVVAMLDKDPEVEVNYDWIRQIQDDFDDILEDEIKYNNEIINKVEDWDSFVESLESDVLASSNNENNFSLWTNLFDWDQEIVDKISSQSHPELQYLDMNMEIVSWMQEALSRNTPEDINMDRASYEQSSKHLNELSETIQEVRPHFADDEEDLSFGPPDAWWDSWWASIEWSMADQVDPSQYVNWFFVKWDDDRYHNVVNWEDKWDDIFNDWTYKFADINSNNDDDIILWDDSNVYIKYANQEQYHDEWSPNYNSDLYETESFESPENLISDANEDWFVSVDWYLYKLWSDDRAVNDFQRSWQSFSSISYSWDTNTNADGYLIRLSKRVDLYHERYNFNWTFDNKYVLVMSNNLDINNARIDDNFELDWWTVNQYINEWKIIDIHDIDINSDNVSISLSNIDKDWHYWEIIPLSAEWAPDSFLYTKSWPWSNQEVAWIQDRSKSLSPNLNSSMTRVSTDETVSQWQRLDWFINTEYDIVFDWDDPWEITGMSISKWWDSYNSTSSWDWEYFWEEVVFDEENDRIIISWFNIDHEEELNYQLSARDHVWNVSNQDVVVRIWIPDVSVDWVSSDWVWSSAIWSLSDSIDDWSIKFEVNRNWTWEVLTWVYPDIPVSRFGIMEDWMSFEWRIFEISNQIGIYHNDNRIWSINRDNWYLNILEEYEDNYDINVSFRDNLPKLFINTDSETIFEIYFQKESFDSIDINLWNYENKEVDWNQYCLYSVDDDRCVIHYNDEWTLVASEYFKDEISASYDFDENSGQIIYNVYNWSNENIATFYLNPKSF